MIKRMLIMLILVGVLLGGVFGFKFFVDGKVAAFMANMGNMPQTVSTTKVASTDWQKELQAVGTMRAFNGADLSLQLPGTVEEINFQSGDVVEKGKVLLRLRNDDDVAIERDGATILIDDLSLVYMGGSVIDFVDDLMGQSFQIRNPNAVASCGCGTSFSI